MGEIQLEVLRSLLAERFGLEVEFGPGGILYKETITEPREGVGHYEPLPVFVQHLFPAVGGKLHAAAAGQRFQFQVHFRAMAQRLVVAHPLHGFGDGLLVQDAAGAELHCQAKPLGQQAAQHLQLDLAHQLDLSLIHI